MSEREWPHDPDGDEGSEGGRTYGMAILAKKVEDAGFPLDRDAFLAEFGADPVRINHGRVVSVEQIFRHVDADTFEDAVAFHRAVGEAMRQGGFWDYHPVGAHSERRSD